MAARLVQLEPTPEAPVMTEVLIKKNSPCRVAPNDCRCGQVMKTLSCAGDAELHAWARGSTQNSSPAAPLHDANALFGTYGFSKSELLPRTRIMHVALKLKGCDLSRSGR
jgi:hypothetical protein